LKGYFIKIYETRYFWGHLVRADLKSRFRRSKLGILWTILNPLLLTMLMSVVFGTVFKMPLNDYAPYILSGLIVWDIFSASFIGGSNSITSGEQYIRQIKHPVTIYTLKYSIVTIINFMIASIALCIWMLASAPQNVILGVISLPLTAFIYLLICWPITTFSGYINTKYRDYPQIIALAIQAVWYVSPVFFKKEMFSSNPLLEMAFNLNPVTHVLNLMREPFLYGNMPSIRSYFITFVFIVFWACIAYIVNRKYEQKVIFYM
jgi:lipopolysaccharide transport system permease protein